MDPILIPILAITFGCTIPVVAIWAKHKQKLAQMQISSTADATAEKAAQYASQVAKLEDRVAVLERIVTDSGYNVATQIEALRDVKAKEDTGSGVPLNISQKEKA